MDLDGVALPILDGTNYLQWKLRMKCILEAKGLDEIVYGTPLVGDWDIKDKPEEALNTGGKNKVAEDKQKEIRARMLLTCAVDAKHTAIIVSCKTAKEIWSRIQNEYADKEHMNVE